MTDFSYQLYSSRNFPPLADTLKMVAAAGYKKVEGYGALYADEAKVAELKRPPRRQRPQDAHRPLRPRQLENDPDRVLDIAKAARHRDDLLPATSPPTSAPTAAPAGSPSASGCRRRRSPTATPASASAGTTTTSSSRRLADGAIPQTAIFEGGPDLEWEADLAWVIKGGADPLEWITTMGKRITAVHLKDIAPAGENTDEDGWADVGHGTVDWRGLMAALQRPPGEVLRRWSTTTRRTPSASPSARIAAAQTALREHAS